MSVLKKLTASGDEMTLENLQMVGKALGSQYKKVSIGRDYGRGGQLAFSAISSGIMAAGGSVKDAGILPAPTLAYSAKGTGCSLMIGPPEKFDESIGLRFMNADSSIFSEEQLMTMHVTDKTPTLPEYNGVGDMTELTNSIGKHKSAILKEIGSADCPVCIDCSSNSASLIVPSLLIDIGCDVIAINSQLNLKTCHQRGIDAVSLRDLSGIVKSNKGDIGIAVNGDGSRIAAIEESGKYVEGGNLLALLAQSLNPRKVVVPVDTSMVINEVTDASLIMTKTGEREISQAIMDNSADFGGSSNGAFIFPRMSYCPDGILSSAMVAKMSGESTLKSLVEGLPKVSREASRIIYERKRPDLTKRMNEEIRSLEYESLCTVEGWRVEMESGWYLIRFFEDNVISIIAEARDKVYMQCLMEIARDIVHHALK